MVHFYPCAHALSSTLDYDDLTRIKVSIIYGDWIRKLDNGKTMHDIFCRDFNLDDLFDDIDYSLSDEPQVTIGLIKNLINQLEKIIDDLAA